MTNRSLMANDFLEHTLKTIERIARYNLAMICQSC
jgi:hypothetical protein